MTAVKMAFGYGLPRSSNVGWFCSLASYSAETTTPQTVAISPIWPAAGSGLKDAALTDAARTPNAMEKRINLAAFIVGLITATRRWRSRESRRTDWHHRFPSHR